MVHALSPPHILQCGHATILCTASSLSMANVLPQARARIVRSRHGQLVRLGPRQMVHLLGFAHISAKS